MPDWADPERFRSSSFIVMAAYAGLSLVFVMLGIALHPIGMAPDESNHFLRAVQISQGELLGVRLGDSSGGIVAPEAREATTALDALKFHRNAHVTSDQLARARAERWTGQRKAIGFPNTVIYAPPFYLALAGGILLGKALGLSVYHTFFLACTFNGMAVVAVFAIAIGLCRRGRAWMIVIATLPMTVHLAASCSQDGLLIATSALAAALLTRLDGPISWRGWLGLILAFGLIGAAKLPLIVLATLMIVLCAPRDRVRAGVSALLAFTLAMAWYAKGIKPFQKTSIVEQGVSEPEQMQFVIAHPFHMLRVGLNTLHLYGDLYAREFMGLLGWLDAPLPTGFYAIASCVALIVLVLSCPWQRMTMVDFIRTGSVLFVLACVAAAIFLSLYMIWTAVGAIVIEGVQGRYFLPLAFFLCPLMAVDTMPGRGPALRRGVATWLAAALAVYGGILVQTTLYHRYWG